MTSDSALASFLERHPWPRELLAMGRPLEYLWVVDIPAPLARVWPFLVDTSRTNRALGFGDMRYVEKGGRLYGATVNGGRRQEWMELPWQWVAERTLLAMRRYSRGFAHVVRFLYEADENGPDATRVGIYFGWIPRSLVGRTALTIGASWMERRYREVLPALAQELPDVGLPPQLTVRATDALTPDGQARLERGKHALHERGLAADLVEKLCEHIASGDELDLVRIQVKRLARQWGTSARELLRVALHATREGLLALSWDVICPHCRGVRDEKRRLSDLPGGGRCEVCEVDFDTRPETAVEVTFHVHPSVRHVEKRWFCAAEPAHRLHIQVQQTLAPGERRRVETRLRPGLYRTRAGGGPLRLVEVKEGADANELVWRPGDDEEARLAPAPALVLENDRDEELAFVLEEARWSDEALRPADLFSLVDFRDLFSEEYIAADVQLSVGMQTILFTDMVGSTRFYATRGDPDAFAQVKRHFGEVFDVVAARGGVVVKTIGDAVMAAFPDPAEGVRAANEIHARFPDGREDLDIRLRISLHRGPCIAVQLNSDIDYFGSTVNLAAKLQACVDAGETAISEELYEAPGVREALAEGGIEPERLSLKVAALDDEVPVLRWTWPPVDEGAATKGERASADVDG